MKRAISLLLVIVMTTIALVGCDSKSENPAGNANSKQPTDESITIKNSPDKYTWYIKNYVGKNCASIGYTSMCGDRMDHYGAGYIELVMVAPDGAYIDIETDDDLKQYVVTAQSYAPNTELKYVSWAYAWAEVKKLYPAASYEVKKFNGLPYVYDPITGFMVYTFVMIEGVSHEMWLPVLDGANKAMKATPYTYTTPKWEYNQQTRRREKVGMEERTVEAASMFDVNKAIMRCLVKNLAMFGLGLYVYAGEDLPEDAAPQPNAAPKKQPKPKSTSENPENPPMPCICVRCNQHIKRVKMKDGSIMQAAEFANTHDGMCAACYKATRFNAA